MKQYHEALKHILDHGVDRPTRTGTDARAVFGMQLRFDMKDGFPAVTTKKLAFKAVVSELLWFISGSGDVRPLQEQGVKIWDANANAPYWVSNPHRQHEWDLGRVYGVQWRSWRKPNGGTIDQLARLIDGLKSNPYDRRHIVMAYNPGELDEMALPPCHAFFQCFVANGKLSLQMYQRSCDMFLGVPFNIASYSLLLHMLAQATNLQPGEFIHTLGDAHIYANHFDQVKTLLQNDPKTLPTLWLDPSVSSIDDFRPHHIELRNYSSHPKIPAPMAV